MGPTHGDRSGPDGVRNSGLCMSLRLLFGALLAASLCGCGASATPAPSPTETGDADTLRDRAQDAWQRLDPVEAAAWADRAVAAGGTSVAMEIAARAHLALGEPDAAAAALERASSPYLRRLRARAQIGAGDYDAAARSLEDDEDAWAEAVRPALVALRNRDAYEIHGASTELALEPLPLPIVRVRIDSVSTLAVVGSSADFVVLDPSIRAQPGVIDELHLGELELRSVPHTVRPLTAIQESLGASIGAVLGLDVLMRLHARLDGPQGRLSLSPTPVAPRPGASAAPFVTPTGSFLAVAGSVHDRPVWLTVDTAGLFPVALVPDADEMLGLESLTWQEDASGAAIAVAERIRIGDLQVESIPVVRGLIGEDHARAVGAPVAGSVGWTLLAQLSTRFDAEGRRLLFE